MNILDQIIEEFKPSQKAILHARYMKALESETKKAPSDRKRVNRTSKIFGG